VLEKLFSLFETLNFALIIKLFIHLNKMFKNKLIRYFILEFQKIFFITILSISLIIWISQAARLLDLVTETGNTFDTYFLYLLTIFPKIFSRLIIFIYFLSLLLTIIKFKNNNELNSLWLSGLKIKDFINQLIFFSFFFLILVIFFKAMIVPFFNNLGRSILIESPIGTFAPLIKEKNFNSPTKDMTIFVKKKNLINEIENIFFFENNDGKKRTILAESGRFIFENNKNLLVLINGNVHEEEKNALEFIKFNKITIDLSNYKKKEIDHYKISELSTYDLFKKALDNIDDQKINSMGELNGRILKPMFIPAITLIISILFFFNKIETKQNLLFFFVFLTGFFFIFAVDVLIDLTNRILILNYIAYFLPFFFFTIFFIINATLQKKGKI